MGDGISDAYDDRTRCRACGHNVYPVAFTCPDCHGDVRGERSESRLTITAPPRRLRLKVITQLDSPVFCTEIFEVDADGNKVRQLDFSQYWDSKEEAIAGTKKIATALRRGRWRFRPRTTKWS